MEQEQNLDIATRILDFLDSIIAKIKNFKPYRVLLAFLKIAPVILLIIPSAFVFLLLVLLTIIRVLNIYAFAGRIWATYFLAAILCYALGIVVIIFTRPKGKIYD